MITVTKTTLPSLDDYAHFLEIIWKTGQITNNGTLCRDLTARLKSYLDLPHINLVSNGTLALQLAIKALALKGEIITTPYSYVATTNAILWEGCDPIFVDIDPNTFCIDPHLIEGSITEKTTAILATHVYGYPCDVQKIQTIADRHGLKVIYDAAHAFGVKFNGQSILEHGDCSTLSFHATKLFHTGEGGAVISRDEKIDQRIFLLSKFGHVGEDNYIDIGINAKLSELHAAMGLAVLPKVEEIIATRKQRSTWYDEYLLGAGLQRPVQVGGLEYNYAYYPVLFRSHRAMITAREALQSKEVFPRRYFYPSLNTLPFLHDALRRSCPVSETLAMRVLCLPMYSELTRETIEMISKRITCDKT